MNGAMSDVPLPPFNDLSSPAALLATRRSGRAREMVEPGPDAASLEAIVASAIRVPDHGKLAPWRWVEIVDRDAFAALLQRAHRAAHGGIVQGEDRIAIDKFARAAPTALALIASPQRSSKIPEWEQLLSVGASAMQLLDAAHARGFVGNWLTGWASYDPTVAAGLAVGEGERIAGFFFIGTPSAPLEERPRPALADRFTRWTG